MLVADKAIDAVSSADVPPATTPAPTIKELRWSQQSGKLTDTSGTLLALGYAGSGIGLNQSRMQSTEFGPLPRGHYTIQSLVEPADPGDVPMVVFSLVPDPNNHMFVRDNFSIRAENSAFNYTGSGGMHGGSIVLDLRTLNIIGAMLEANDIVTLTVIA